MKESVRRHRFLNLPSEFKKTVEHKGEDKAKCSKEQFPNV